MAITALPTPPSRSDPANFASRSDIFLGQLPTFGTEANALAVEMNNIYTLAMSNGMANAAANAATATAKAVESLANAGVATTQNAAAGSSAALAQGSATAASVAKDAAIAAWVAATYPAETLAAQSQIAHIGTVVDSCIDYPWTHSDGGAWTDRCQDKSWYKETLGGSRWLPAQATIAAAWAAAGSATGAVFQASATAGPLTSGKFYAAASATTATEVWRGIKREYPKAGVLWIAESARAVGYDLGTGAMWMVFEATASKMWWGSISTVTSIAVAQGFVCVGGTGSGMRAVSFCADAVNSAGPSVTTRPTGGVSNRHATAAWSGTSLPAIVNATVNDVALTVLDGAPIDPSTGIATPTIAVFTVGGVSVIHNTGNVVSGSYAGHTSAGGFKNGYFYYQRSGATNGLTYLPIAGLVSSFLGTDVGSGTIPNTGATSKPTPAGDKVALSGATQITVIKENPATPAKGMVAYITNAYNTGWQVGDSRGAYLADTVAETIVGSGELVTNGTFATDTSGWTAGSSATLSVVSGVLRVTNGAALNGYASQGFTTVVNRAYTLSVTIATGTSTGGLYIGTSIGSGAIGGLTIATASGTYSVTFVATTATTYVTAIINAVSGNSCDFDNVSVKLAEPDRSVKNNGLIVNGTLTKSAVSSGANLVAYSGFSATNYLEQPYSANLDFGTGDFCIMGWVNLSSISAYQVLFQRSTSGAAGGIALTATSTTGVLTSYVSANTTDVAIAATTTGLTANSWALVELSRVGTAVNTYINTVLAASGTSSANVNGSSPVFRLGVSTSGTLPVLGSMALWRVSATVPSADQRSQIYRDELPLFSAGAQCTIAGTSTAVTAMDYDSTTDLLHVGTSWGRTSFKGLLQVDSEATTVGAITSLAASGGTVVTGGTSAKLSAPSIVVRDALKDKALAAKALSKTYSIQDLTIASFTGATTNGSTAVTASSISTAPYAPYVGMVIAGTGIVAGTFIAAISGSAYTLSVAATATGSAAIVQSVIPVTRGYTVKIVSKNGLPIREATTGVYWTRSNDGYVEYVTPSVAPTVGDWFSFEIVRS